MMGWLKLAVVFLALANKGEALSKPWAKKKASAESALSLEAKTLAERHSTGGETERRVLCSELPVFPDDQKFCYAGCGAECPPAIKDSRGDVMALAADPSNSQPCFERNIRKEQMACRAIPSEDVGLAAKFASDEQLMSAQKAPASLLRLTHPEDYEDIAEADDLAAQAMEPRGSGEQQSSSKGLSLAVIGIIVGGSLIGLFMIVGVLYACCRPDYESPYEG